MRFFGTLVFCVALFSCGLEKKSNNTQPGNNPEFSLGDNTSIQSKDLGLVGTEFDSFRDYPIEQRCNALKDALERFSDQHTPGVTIYVGQCDNRINKSLPGYQIKFEISKDNVRYPHSIEISKLNEKRPDYLFFSGNGGRSVLDFYDAKLGEIHQALGNLHATLLAFVGGAKDEATIYDHTYSEFTARVIEIAPKGLLTLGDKTLPVKFELSPDGENSNVGSVKFLEVPEQAFNQASDGLTSSTPGLLGCSNIKCLNESGVRFEFEEQSLDLVREIQVDSGVQIRTWIGWSFGAFPTNSSVSSLK